MNAPTRDWLKIDDGPVTLRALIVQKLRMAITRGHFSPGDRLIERELCERLDVSRASVREAFRQLEAEGLVEVVTYRGPVVRTISQQEAGELYDLRAGVEALCARYFAERGTDAETLALERAAEALGVALRRGDRERVFEAKSTYYEIFTDGCHSASVKATAMQLIARLSYLWSTSLQVAGRADQGSAELKAVAGAIRQRDPAAAEEAARTYVMHARATGLAAMAAQAAGHAPGKKPARRHLRAVEAKGSDR
ncbi:MULTISPECIES: GntR family transcriptional regulator [Ramlibacter]|nr:MULTISPECIES: GntR family transcriptional regulator [Ramlibacter]MBA2963527.1 GntR family transcriptional regulator [Ramlibacter sp. CGMCC 1.13660]